MALSVAALRLLRRYPRECGAFLAAAVPAVYLIVRGNTLDHRQVLWLHIGLAAGAVVLIGWRILRSETARPYRTAFAAAACLFALLPASRALYDEVRPGPNGEILNPPAAPLSMDQEGAGASSPFSPSSAQHQYRRHHSLELLHGFRSTAASATRTSTSNGKARCIISHRSTTSSTGNRSNTCRTSAGTRPSKWCAGCHDHAVFFNGRFDRPIKDQIDTPEAQAGLGCMSCHSIVHVASTMGNADFTIEYPPLHQLASSRNPYLRAFDAFLTYLNPEPHRATL